MKRLRPLILLLLFASHSVFAQTSDAKTCAEIFAETFSTLTDKSNIVEDFVNPRIPPKSGVKTIGDSNSIAVTAWRQSNYTSQVGKSDYYISELVSKDIPLPPLQSPYLLKNLPSQISREVQHLWDRSFDPNLVKIERQRARKLKKELEKTGDPKIKQTLAMRDTALESQIAPAVEIRCFQFVMKSRKVVNFRA